MEKYSAIHFFPFDEELSVEENLRASRDWRESIARILKEIDPTLTGQYHGNGFLVVTHSKEIFEKLISSGFKDVCKFMAFAEASYAYKKKNENELANLKKRIDALSVPEKK